ncbi:MAG TPA: AMIN domain-containing protein, partial [Methylophilaceae bacterium]|nr:AMIN domain-containing protein [Methylophilaceae bacterium]
MLARLLLVLSLLTIFTQVQAATVITAARVWPSAEYTRITLESSKPITHRMVMLKDPDRLVLDLD